MARLTLAARLRQLGYGSYNSYLRSPHWQAMKRRVYQARAAREPGPPLCSRCRSPGPLQVHHLTYLRLGREHLADLTLLCEGCHSHAHGRDLTRRRTRVPHAGKASPARPPVTPRRQSELAQNIPASVTSRPWVGQPAVGVVLETVWLRCGCSTVFMSACRCELHY